MLHRQPCGWREAARGHGPIQMRMVLVAALVVLREGVLPVQLKMRVLVFCRRSAETVTVMGVAWDKGVGVTAVRIRN